MIHHIDPAILATPYGAIYWYGAVYSFGFLGVFVWFWYRRRARGLSDRDVFSLSVVFSVGVLLGARGFDILVYELDYYREHPLAALNWWEGGMASHGVLLGGLIAILLFARTRRLSLVALLDEIVVPGAFLLAVGRLGNFVEGGVVGSVTELPWGIVYPDLDGARHPVALYESAKNFLILPILIVALRLFPAGRGIVLSMFLFLYAGLRFAVDVLRDYEAAWLGIGTGQVFNLFLAAVGLTMFWYLSRYPRRPDMPVRVAARSPRWIDILLLVAVILYPLGIPTSWTANNIAEKRQEARDGSN
ncbi:MAG: prolipoprotein diacylglyceryl transferase [Paracoccaceae bacterium]